MGYTSDESTEGMGPTMKEVSNKIRSAHLQAPEEYPEAHQNEGDVPEEAKEAAEPAPEPKEKSDSEMNQDPHKLLGDEKEIEDEDEVTSEADDVVKKNMSADPEVTRMMCGCREPMTMARMSARIRNAQPAGDEELPISPAETVEEQRQIMPIADQFAKPETAPSKKPPKEWWDKKVAEVRKSNPGYSQTQVDKTVGDIWYNEMETGQRSERRSAEGKTYG